MTRSSFPSSGPSLTSMNVSQRKLATVTVGCLPLALGCEDALLPDWSPPSTMRSLQGPLPHGIQFSVGAGSTNAAPDNGGLPYASTGLTVPAGAVARISASGDLTLSENSDCDGGVFWGDIRSPVSPAGTVNNFGRVDVSFATNLDFDTQWTGRNPGEFVVHLSNTSGTPVLLLAARQGIPGECLLTGSEPPVSTFDFYINGGTTLTMDILGVNLTSSAQTVLLGQSAHFESAPLNFTASAPIVWSFETDAGQQTELGACASAQMCDYAPPQSGQMQVCMNDEQAYSICTTLRIEVIKCPTGDSLLDNPVLRAGLLQALKDSWADSLPSSRRREVAGYAFFDSAGLHVVRTEDPSKYHPCKVDYSAPANAALIFHVHPVNPPEGFSLADTLPTMCGSAGSTRRYDTKTWGGPSAEDWGSSVQVHHPSYIIDKKRVYVTNPLVTDSTKWADSTKKYDWNTRKCRW